MFRISECDNCRQSKNMSGLALPQKSPFVSICVSTDNGQHSLDEFLERLAGFDRLDYELVISDNALQSRTEQVVLNWSSYLKALTYLRQEETLSPPENVCAACNAARGDYIFHIAHDARLIEDGLLAAKRILDDDQTCAAVYGSYNVCGHNFDTIQHRIDYSSVPMRIRQGQQLEMYRRLRSVELPMFRRTIYQRHMMGHARQFPLEFYAAGRFLHYGDLLFIPDITATIRRHSEQGSENIFEGRMLQERLTDYEMFLNEVPGLETANMIAAYLEKCIDTYLTAMEQAVRHGRFLEAHRILKRALAYRIDGIQSVAITFEKNHLANVLAAYVFELHRLHPSIGRIILQRSMRADELKPLIERKLGNRISVLLMTKDTLMSLPPNESDMVIVTDSETMHRRLLTLGANPAKHRSLDDIVDACSVF